jgi:hypothetical protein
MESAIERLAREGSQPMIEGIRRTDEQGLRYFIVNMVDGKLFACCPNADAPNKHGEWLLSEILDSGERLDFLGWILSLRDGDVPPGRRADEGPDPLVGRPRTCEELTSAYLGFPF